jgi:hypothetical protein
MAEECQLHAVVRWQPRRITRRGCRSVRVLASPACGTAEDGSANQESEHDKAGTHPEATGRVANPKGVHLLTVNRDPAGVTVEWLLERNAGHGICGKKDPMQF